ncbi:MAG: hypothetical protein P4M12_06730 [Gammaproteobacteria bacterium]|nr:hypothetical protein [Gammaproteobacteria bacterium]
MSSSNASGGAAKKRKRPSSTKYIFLDSPESEAVWSNSELSDRDTRKVNMQIKFDLSKEEFDASAIIAKSEETKSTVESTCSFVECKTAGNYRPISFPIKKNCKMWTCHASSVNDIKVDERSNAHYYPLIMVPPQPGEFPYPWVPCGAYMPMPSGSDSCECESVGICIECDEGICIWTLFSHYTFP